MPDALVEQAAALVDRTGMLPDGCSVLAAVSGGQDSCALLHVLHALAPARGWRIAAAHLHHALRGADADGDAAMVRDLAGSLGIGVHIAKADVRGLARRRRVSLEEAGRIARRAFLDRTAAETRSDRVALGHTLDDRVETLLLNLMRGTSPDGLGAMPPVAGTRVRPLLEARRAETEAYCRRHSIPFRTDAHNLDLSYARNRVRAELLPMMAAYYNPSLTDGLARLAALAADDADLLAGLADRALDACVVDSAEGRITLAAGPLAELHPALRRRALRRALERAAGNLADVEYVHTEGIDRLLLAAAAGERGSVSLPGNARATAAGRRVTLSARPPSAPVRVREALDVPGRAVLPGPGLVVTAEWGSAPGALPALDGPEAWVAAAAVQPPLAVRTRLVGDRLRPLGAPGSRKLQDLLTDRKVPREERGRVLLVEDRGGILWVVGHTVAERGRLAPGDGPALRLRVTPFVETQDC